MEKRGITVFIGFFMYQQLESPNSMSVLINLLIAISLARTDYEIGVETVGNQVENLFNVCWLISFNSYWN
jgi:hypothetical protein